MSKKKSTETSKPSTNPVEETYPVHLYSPTDVRRIRSKLYEEQGGCDALTLLPLEPNKAVLDHDHITQYVRGVIHRSNNSFIGRIELAYIRDMKWWCPTPLPSLLKQTAHYLEKEQDQRYLHPGWMKAVVIMFKKLTEPQKDEVLKKFDRESKNNSKLRIKEFESVVKSKMFTYQQLKEEIQKFHEYNI